MNYKLRFSILIIFFQTCIHISSNLFSQTLESTVDSLIRNELKDANGPGYVFLIAKNGKSIYQRGFGKANLELNIDLRPEHVFQIGSMTKQFTAVAILMLEEKGLLSVNDRLSKYIPTYPSGDSITLHHLLTHTSGIKDFTAMKELKDIAQKEMSPKMMIDFFKNETDDFAPGELFKYNNSGYVILGQIIELLSGQTYDEFIQQNIFDKAGMNQSYYASDRKVIPNRAYGYQKKQEDFLNKTAISFTIPHASGALMSTAADLLKWQNAINGNLLVNDESKIKVFSNYKLKNGEAINYGYGLHLKEINGTATREHGGSIFGFKSMGVYIPSLDIYVVGLSNCDCNSPTQLVRNIGALCIRMSCK